MFKHYLKIAFQSARRRKAYSVITVSGLTIGLASAILILVHMVTELSYDRHHRQADRIYRLCSNLTLGDTENEIATSNAAPAFVFPESLPEVVDATVVRPMSKVLVEYQERQLYEERVVYAGTSFFDIFTFSMLRGDPQTALTAAGSIVITEATARKYFGAADPMGEILRFNGERDYAVTGVIRDVPETSHFVFDMLCSFETLRAADPEGTTSWSTPFYHLTYLLLGENADPRVLEEKLPALVEEHMGEGLRASGAALRYFLQPLTSIHLHSRLRHELAANSDVKYLYVFGAVAVAILAVACFNFLNIATARSSTRAREVAVRKTLGADRRELVTQFLTESVLYSLVSLGLALVLVHLALPTLGPLLAADSGALSEGVHSMSRRTLTIDYAAMPWLIPAFLGLALLVGLLAGAYPALFLASFRPSQIMGGGFRTGRWNANLRRGLVGLQFTVSVALMICSGIVYQQLEFLRGMKLGFQKDHVVVIPLMGNAVRTSLPSIEVELGRHRGVIGVGASSHVLGGRPSGGSFIPEGYSEGQTEMMDWISIDESYLPTLGMDIAAGRGFSEEFPSDAEQSILINEAAARKFQWDDPIGKRIRTAGDTEGKEVIGVVTDFHFSSPHRLVSPIYIALQKDRLRSLFVRIEPDEIPATLASLEETWSRFDPGRPFEYSFLDTSYDQQYRAEENLSKLFGIFSLLAIFIACLGLLGIASFSVERRTKEIGIRKVLGSSVLGIVILLSKELVALSLLSLAVAWPLAHFTMQSWLAAFPYRMAPSLWIFASAGLIMMLIAVATISYHSIKAGLVNPIAALRDQ